MRARSDFDASVRPIDLTGRQRLLEPAKATLRGVARLFARGARRSLPFLVRQRGRVVPAEATMVAPEQHPIPGPRCRARLESDDGFCWALVEVDTDAINLIVDGVLGGGAHEDDDDVEGVGPELTVAQRALLGRIVRGLSEDVAAAFRTVASIEMKITGVETLRAGDVPNLEDDALAVACALEGMGQGGNVTIFVSAEALESATRGNSSGELSAPDPRIADAMESVALEVVAELGRAKLGLRQILALKTGDVVRLTTAIDDPVAVCISGIPKLTGAPVVSRGQLAIQIKGRHGE